MQPFPQLTALERYAVLAEVWMLLDDENTWRQYTTRGLAFTACTKEGISYRTFSASFPFGIYSFIEENSGRDGARIFVWSQMCSAAVELDG